MSSVLTRPKYRNILRFKRIHYSIRKRIVRSNNNEADLLLLSKSRQRIELVNRNRHNLCHLANTGITRCTINRVRLRTLGQRPANRMLAAAAANH
ncbi:hypothetical protein D3C77_422430 [compost metagenome]